MPASLSRPASDPPPGYFAITGRDHDEPWPVTRIAGRQRSYRHDFVLVLRYAAAARNATDPPRKFAIGSIRAAALR